MKDSQLTIFGIILVVMSLICTYGDSGQISSIEKELTEVHSETRRSKNMIIECDNSYYYLQKRVKQLEDLMSAKDGKNASD